jgi:hypothetical protein
MFERYTEKARRVIFFARYEASEFGSPYIETEHLLLGLLREDKALAHRFLGTTSSESIRKQIEDHTVVRAKFPTSVDLPLSHESSRVLAYVAEEAQRLNHQHFGTEHLLLALLREEQCFAAAILQERGLQLALVRDKIASDESARSDPIELDKFRNSLVTYFTARQKEWGVTVVNDIRKREICIFAGEPALGLPPFVSIEVISPDDRFRALQERIDDYLADRVRYVWLLDPVARRAYAATAQFGLREVKESALATENPTVRLPLDEIFA